MLKTLIQTAVSAVIVLAGISHMAFGVDPARIGRLPVVPTRTAYVVPTSTATPATTSTIPTVRDRLSLPGEFAPQLAPMPGMPSRGPRWRLGVYSQDTEIGVRILRTVPNSPADRAGLEPEDYIVAVEGYQVGIVNGHQFDCGNEFDRRADSQGNCMLLVYDNRNGRLVNLPIKLESRLAKITGSIAYRNRIYLPQNAIATVELRESYNGRPQGNVLGKQEIYDFRQIPIPFEIEYDPGDVNARKTYVVTASITSNGRPLYNTVQQYPVITNGRPRTASIEVERAIVDTQTAANNDRAQIEQQIVNYFRAYFGREPMASEMPFWTAPVERGRSMFDIQADMASNSAVWNRCNHDEAEYIRLLHEAVLNKQPTQEELDYWMYQYQKSGGLRRPLAEELLTAAGVPR